MERLPLIDPETATGPAGESLRASPVRLNLFRMLAHAESCQTGLGELGRAVLGKQKLGHRPRELVILLACHLERGAYVWRQHAPIAEGLGVPREQIEAIERGDITAPVFDAAEQALLAFTRQVVVMVRVDDAVFDAVKQHYSATEIVEAIIAAGYYMMMIRVSEATRVPLDPSAGMKVFDAIRARAEAEMAS